NRADVVVATIDRMGIPLTLLARAGLLRTALVYVSVGLPERLERLHGPARRLHLAALRRVDVFVAYSAYEAEMIREGIGSASRARSGPTATRVPRPCSCRRSRRAGRSSSPEPLRSRRDTGFATV